jgi:nucleotide-binding universal stress UspA family protein
MLKKILVALDKASVSRQAFDAAVQLAKGLKAELLLFHAMTHSEPGSPQVPMIYSGSYDPHLTEVLREDYEREWNEYVGQYVDLLRWRAQAAQAEGIPTIYRQEYGVPGRVICDMARTWQADLIVMGSHGRTGLQEMWLGSVSNYVTHHAPCSVFLVHPAGTAKQTAEPATSAALAS